MQILELDKLKEIYESFYYYLIELKSTSEDLEYLYKESNIDDHISNGPFLLRVKNSIKIKFALDFCIILSKKEDNNLFKFIESLICNYNHSIPKDSIALKDLELYKREVESMINGNAYATLKYMRDKIYAHRDKNFGNTNLSATLIDVKLELDKLMDIFHKIGSQIFNIHYEMEVSEVDKGYGVLEMNEILISARQEYWDLLISGKTSLTMNEIKQLLFIDS